MSTPHVECIECDALIEAEGYDYEHDEWIWPEYCASCGVDDYSYASSGIDEREDFHADG